MQQINWDSAMSADQQARTLVTILNAEIAVMRKRIVELEKDVAVLSRRVRALDPRSPWDAS